jgi:hypothetical protein
MKNIFKLMGLAMMASALFVACGDDEEETDTVAEGIKVTFKNTTWNGNVNQSSYNADYNLVHFAAAEAAQELPMFDEGFLSSEAGTVTESAGANGSFGQESTHNWVEYYENTYLTDNNNNYYGDWWAEQATTTITSIDLTALTVSAKMNGTMFDAKTAFVGEEAEGLTPSTPRADYSASFGKVSLESK